MKVLIQDSKDRLFLAGEGVWTGRVEDARDFGVTTLAYNFAVQHIFGPFRITLHLPATDELIAFDTGQGRAVAAV